MPHTPSASAASGSGRAHTHGGGSIGGIDAIMPAVAARAGPVPS